MLMTQHWCSKAATSLAAVAVIWIGIDSVTAAPLNPSDFQAAAMANGAFPTPGDAQMDFVIKVSTFDTPNGLYLQKPDGTKISGTFVNGVGVFAFTSIDLRANVRIVTDNSVGGDIGSSRSFALLSLGDATIAGRINLDGFGGSMGGIPSPMMVPPGLSGTGGGDGGDGGSTQTGFRGNGGFGPEGNRNGPGGGNGGTPSAEIIGGGGGGAFGAAGGAGAGSTPGTGGTAYGDLLQKIQGGSGGGRPVAGWRGPAGTGDGARTLAGVRRPGHRAIRTAAGQLAA
jgi:hypothetical protein